MTDTRKRNHPTLNNTPEHMTALSILGPYALRRSVRRFFFSSRTRQDDGSLGIGITQWLVLQKDKDAQRSCAIAVDIAGALSK